VDWSGLKTPPRRVFTLGELWLSRLCARSVVGLLTNLVGTSKHHLLIRTGSIAVMPSDEVAMEDRPMEVYLAEWHSIGGLSGSPVFVGPTARIAGLGNQTGTIHLFLGIATRVIRQGLATRIPRPFRGFVPIQWPSKPSSLTQRPIHFLPHSGITAMSGESL